MFKTIKCNFCMYDECTIYKTKSKYLKVIRIFNLEKYSILKNIKISIFYFILY